MLPYCPAFSTHALVLHRKNNCCVILSKQEWDQMIQQAKDERKRRTSTSRLAAKRGSTARKRRQSGCVLCSRRTGRSCVVACFVTLRRSARPTPPVSFSRARAERRRQDVRLRARSLDPSLRCPRYGRPLFSRHGGAQKMVTEQFVDESAR